MIPLVTFEKIVPGGLASGWTTRDAAGTRWAQTSHRSKPIGAARGFDWCVVPTLGVQIPSRDRVGTLWDNDDTQTTSSLQSTQYRNFAEQLDTAPRSCAGKQR